MNTRFKIGDIVVHRIIDIMEENPSEIPGNEPQVSRTNLKGIITGILIRGADHTVVEYEITWNTDTKGWYSEVELELYND